jgi:tRNA G46 methylase TrmB
MKRESKDIIDSEADATKDAVNNQQPHWEKVFENTCSRFGDEPSYPAQKAAAIFEKEEKKKILELGSGQGRDTCFLSVKAFMYTRLITLKAG